MLKIRLYYLITIGILLIIFACDDVLVPDISDDRLFLKAPADSLITNLQTHTFWWDEMDDASGYNLQIVSPGFNAPSSLIADTSLTERQFTLTLSEGTYAWSVLAFNEAYFSKGDTFLLIIQNDPGSNLSGQHINLQSPVNDLCTNADSIHFYWNELAGADIYTLQIGDEDFSSLVVNEQLPDATFSTSLISEGIHYWRVRAESTASFTFTAWQSRRFTIDRTSPTVPVLLSPDDGVVLGVELQDPDLIWNADSEAIADTLFLFDDVQATTLLFRGATTTGTFNLEDSGIDFNTGVLEDYYWQVVSIDKAGNVSDPSELGFFFVE